MKFFNTLILLLTVLSALGQQISVEGICIDKKGKPISEVTITDQRHETLLSTTDAKGKFAFEAVLKSLLRDPGETKKQREPEKKQLPAVKISLSTLAVSPPSNGKNQENSRKYSRYLTK